MAEDKKGKSGLAKDKGNSGLAKDKGNSGLAKNKKGKSGWAGAPFHSKLLSQPDPHFWSFSGQNVTFCIILRSKCDM